LLGLLGQPQGQRAVEVIATQGRVPTGRQDFKNALRQAQDGDVERAATQVIDGEGAFSRLVEAVGDRRGRRLVEQAEHVQTSQSRRVLRGLALGIVEVGRHRDDDAGKLTPHRAFGTQLERTQDVG
jgi:hypothetical protein